MGIESASFISQLDSANPKGTDQRSTLDDHARLLKKCARDTLKNLNSTVSATPQALNFVNTLTANAQTQLNQLDSDRKSTSAALMAEIASASQSLVNAMLFQSATAANSILWDGSAKYMQSATPTMNNGDVWFEPY